MLLHLSVENFILIHQLELDLHEGFTCITGETGAGKSILVGALGLILGQRADTQVLMDKNRKCIVEGQIALEGYGLEPVFEKADLDFEPVSTFRREITPQGKSRAFINDTPVNLTVMKEFGDRLVDIHSQNQTLQMNAAGFQLAMIDSYAGNSQTLAEYSRKYEHYLDLRNDLENSVELEKKANADRDYFEYQLDELNKAELSENEQEEAEAELSLLNHAEEIITRVQTTLGLIDDEENSILANLHEARQSIDHASRFSTQLEPVSGRIENSYQDLKEIVRELREFAGHITFNPDRIRELSDRLDLIYHLQQKHKVASVKELLELKTNISIRLNEINSLSERITQLTAELASAEIELSGLADVLSEKRTAVISGIEIEMEKVLQELGMPSARLKIALESLDYLSKSGHDKVTFLFAANKGSEPREIQKVASGGELSRLMLAIKSLIVQRSLLPTILFDEIDSGVSGEIAGKIGNIMRRLSDNVQVIAITHLPQIAGKAGYHILASKQDNALTAVTSLRQLSDAERIDEIARMLSDETITESARAAAKELMIN